IEYDERPTSSRDVDDVDPAALRRSRDGGQPVAVTRPGREDRELPAGAVARDVCERLDGTRVDDRYVPGRVDERDVVRRVSGRSRLGWLRHRTGRDHAGNRDGSQLPDPRA